MVVLRFTLGPPLLFPGGGCPLFPVLHFAFPLNIQWPLTIFVLNFYRTKLISKKQFLYMHAKLSRVGSSPLERVPLFFERSSSLERVARS
jgi:hypothetical protein